MSDKPPRLCCCFNYTADQLRQIALAHGIVTQPELTAVSRAGSGCRTCVPDLVKLLEELWRDRPGPSRPTTPEGIVLAAIAPFLRQPPFELELFDVDGATIRIRAAIRRPLPPGAEETFRVFIENTLKEAFRPDAAVIFV